MFQRLVVRCLACRCPVRHNRDDVRVRNLSLLGRRRCLGSGVRDSTGSLQPTVFTFVHQHLLCVCVCVCVCGPGGRGAYIVQALRRSPAKKGKTYERPGLSEEEIEEIREAFNLFDTDGSGVCSCRSAD